MGQSPDELREEISQRRIDAADKIDRLQDQVQDTTDDLRAQAKDTVADVQEQVKDTVDDSIEMVKENLDFHEQIQERPLVSLGVALIGGFVVGGMLGGGHHKSHQSSDHHAEVGSAYSSRAGGGGGIGETMQHAYKSSGLEETFSNAAAALMGSVMEQMKQTVDRNVPGFSQKMEQAKNTSGSVMDKSRKMT